MNYTELLSLIIILILVGTTLQLVVIKNNIDRKWNDRYGHIIGGYCFLCVSFWINFILTGVYVLTGNDLSVFSVIFIIFSVPTGVSYLISKIDSSYGD